MRGNQFYYTDNPSEKLLRKAQVHLQTNFFMLMAIIFLGSPISIEMRRSLPLTHVNEL